MTTRISAAWLKALTLPAALALTVAILSAFGGNDVTRVRLEKSIAPTFANLYVQQATLLGHPGVTVASTAATASCDKGGPKVADVGPGANWVCTLTFNDQTHVKQTGNFELNVHANSCYTAAGPSKLIGLAVITDQRGNDATNPVFEFDGCFNPSS
jgi:hypothetical protein